MKSRESRVKSQESRITHHVSRITNHDAVLLEWHVHLAKQQPKKAVVVVVAIAGAAALGYFWLQTFWAALVAALILTASVSDFLFPVRYRLSETHAEARSLFSWHQIAWDRVKTCYVGDEGVKLSPFSVPTRLEAFRGVYLRYPSERRKLLDIIASHARKAKRVAKPG